MLGPTGDSTNKLIEYLIKVCPSSLEAKSDLGYTPLFLACLMGRVQFAKTLIKAGADQSVKDKEFNNIIHACLTNRPRLDQLREMLELFDSDLRAHMFLQRNHLAHGGDTPLHFWFKKTNPWPNDHCYMNRRYRPAEFPEQDDYVKVLRLLLEFSKGEDLEILNGSGDTVLHTSVLRSLPTQTKVILEQNPKLLYRENAVGRTPGEIAYDVFTSYRVAGLDSIVIQSHNVFARKLIDNNPEQFLQDAQPKKSRRDATWSVVQEYLAGVEEKRRLVSLNEANDVAKRLGENYSWQRYYTHKKVNADDDGEEEEKKDEKETDFVTSKYEWQKPGAWL